MVFKTLKKKMKIFPLVTLWLQHFRNTYVCTYMKPTSEKIVKAKYYVSAKTCDDIQRIFL